MSGRTGLRRARVLLALGDEPKRFSTVIREVDLSWKAVSDTLDSLLADGLIVMDLNGVRLGQEPDVAVAQAEAQALLEARGVGV